MSNVSSLWVSCPSSVEGNNICLSRGIVSIKWHDVYEVLAQGPHLDWCWVRMRSSYRAVVKVVCVLLRIGSNPSAALELTAVLRNSYPRMVWGCTGAPDCSQFESLTAFQGPSALIVSSLILKHDLLFSSWFFKTCFCGV